MSWKYADVEFDDVEILSERRQRGVNIEDWDRKMRDGKLEMENDRRKKEKYYPFGNHITLWRYNKTVISIIITSLDLSRFKSFAMPISRVNLLSDWIVYR